MNLDDLKDLKKQYDDAVEASGKEALLNSVKELFNKHPNVEKIGWVGYVPGFNDGSPCTFGLGEFYLAIKRTENNVEELPNDEQQEEDDSDPFDDDEDENDMESWESDGASEELKIDFRNLERDFNKLSDILESVFGENHKVIIHNDDKLTLEQSDYDCGY